MTTNNYDAVTKTYVDAIFDGVTTNYVEMKPLCLGVPAGCIEFGRLKKEIISYCAAKLFGFVPSTAKAQNQAERLMLNVYSKRPSGQVLRVELLPDMTGYIDDCTISLEVRLNAFGETTCIVNTITLPILMNAVRERSTLLDETVVKIPYGDTQKAIEYGWLEVMWQVEEMILRLTREFINRMES